MDKTVSILIKAYGAQAKREIKSLHVDIERLSKTARKVSLVSLAFGGTIAGAALMGGRAAVKAAGDMEVLNTAFTTLLGSTAAAKKTMAELYKFAAETPFEDADVYRFGRSLLAAGFQAKDLTKVLTQVGDAVSAVGGGAEGMDRVIRAFLQMRAKGKISQEELNQISELGIPINRMLQEQMGLTAKQMENIGRAGIPAEKAIDALLKGMAKFGAGGMEKQSKTLVGLASTLSSEIKKLLTNVEGTGIGDRMLPDVKRAVTSILTEFKRLEADGTLKRFANDMGRMFLQGFEAMRKGVSFMLKNGPLVANIVKWTVIAGGVALLVGAVSGLVSMASGIVKLVGALKLLTTAFIGLQTAQIGAAAGTTGFVAGMANIIAKTPGWLKALALVSGAVYLIKKRMDQVEQRKVAVDNAAMTGDKYNQYQLQRYQKLPKDIQSKYGTVKESDGQEKVMTMAEWNALSVTYRRGFQDKERVRFETVQPRHRSPYETTMPGGSQATSPYTLVHIAPEPGKKRLTFYPTPGNSDVNKALKKAFDEAEAREFTAEADADAKRLLASANEVASAATGGSVTPASTKVVTDDSESRVAELQRLIRDAASITLRSQPESLVNTREMARRENEQWHKDSLAEAKGNAEAIEAVNTAFAARNSAIWREYYAGVTKAPEDAAERQKQAVEEQRRVEEEASERRFSALDEFKASIADLDEAQRENHRNRLDEMLERASQSKTLSDQEKANIIAEFETWWALEIQRKKARQEELRTMAAVALVTGDFLRAARLQLEAIAAAIAVSDTQIARDKDIADISKRLEPEPAQAPETWRDRWRREWEERAKIAEQAMEGVVQSFSSRLGDGLTGAKDAWKNFWKDLKNIALNAIKAIIEAWIKGQVSGVGGQMSGGQPVGGGVSAVMSTAMQAAGMPVQGGMMPNAILPPGGKGGGMSNLLGGLLGKKIGVSTLGGVLGAGMLGYSLAPMLFGKNNYSGAGGGLGAMLGMAMLGPWGILAGGLLGGAFGSLFKKKRKPKPQAPGGFWEPNLYGWGMDQGAPAFGMTTAPQGNPWNRPGPGIEVRQVINNYAPRPIDGLSQDLADRVARAGRVR